ncbi:hypothetical protein Pla52o_15340 [Novipirellula galeiformis]|uniref:Uncharacterized protein n=1 Tax=Novipirellula galeiformis TaxID=2528004 RepID=A0A5C6CQ70_9BACT|nr:hypothetical protein Pla52o_15340 [Novipirellula galeiformis]
MLFEINNNARSVVERWRVEAWRASLPSADGAHVSETTTVTTTKTQRIGALAIRRLHKLDQSFGGNNEKLPPFEVQLTPQGAGYRARNDQLRRS